MNRELKLWVKTWRVPPPVNQTILGRYGAILYFVAYSKWRDQWFIVSNGRELAIAEGPDVWFCSGEYASAHEIVGAVPPVKLDQPTKSLRRRKGASQLGLDLSVR